MIYVTKKCPHCNYAFEIHKREKKFAFGPVFISCPKCKKPIRIPENHEIALMSEEEIKKHFSSTTDSAILAVVFFWGPFLSLFSWGFLSTIIDQNIFNDIKFILLVVLYVTITYIFLKDNLNTKNENPFIHYKNEINDSMQRLNNSYYRLLLEYNGYKINEDSYYAKNKK